MADSARRYVVIVQAREGYPPPGELDGPEPPVLHSAVLADTYDALVADRDRLREFAEWLISMDDPEDVIGRAERQQVTLTAIIGRARQAVGNEER